MTETSGRGTGWIGVDLDGTLANYQGWDTAEHKIGKPIKKMVDRVKGWMAEGKTVKIFTARVGPGNDVEAQRQMVSEWCFEHLGRAIEVTATKDYGMYELWDDRCVQIQTNTGLTVTEWAGLLNGVVLRQSEAAQRSGQSSAPASTPADDPTGFVD